MHDRASILRARIRDGSKGPVAAPGAFNALSALAIEQAGFEAVYISGAGLANSVFGEPDVGLTTLTEAAEHANRTTSAVKLPTICDADTGFGETVNVARTVEQLGQAGVAGIHLEDQQLPKRCGHLSGKTLIEPSHMCEKIRAAAHARSGFDLFIIARVDSRGVLGLDDAIDRAKRYVGAGADAVFPEALENKAEFEQFAQALNVPLLANMTEFGKSPLLSVQELGEMGYRLVIFPMTLLRAAMHSMTALLGDLKSAGTQKDWLDRMQTREALYDLLDYDGLKAIDDASQSAD